MENIMKNPIRRLRSSAAAFIALSCLTGSVWAADSIHVRGTVASVDGSAVTIKTNGGKDIGLTIGDDWRIAGVVPASLSDVKKGVFIGTANVQDSSGNRALEVVVFPEKMRGTGEGDYGWDLKPKSSMTNANVEQTVESVDGSTVTLKYKGGEKTVTIAPSTPIVTFADATKDDVKPGAKVFISGTPNPDGTMLTKGFLAVGKDGTTPPM
jgi:Domain of unknown function (DUF5666)